MNIEDNEIIKILMEYIHPSEWSINDFNLSLERATPFTSNGVEAVLFPCSMVDIILYPNGDYFDAHPHI